MEYSEVLAARHSVRRYTEEKINKAEIDAILEEARLAPSSKNSKSTSFLVIEDAGKLEEISKMRTFGSSFISDAPAAVVVLGDETKTDLWVDNASISATYVMLSATNRGIGSCWVHVNGRPHVKDDPSKGTAEEYLRKIIDIPQGLRPLCVVALGYEAK